MDWTQGISCRCLGKHLLKNKKLGNQFIIDWPLAVRYVVQSSIYSKASLIQNLIFQDTRLFEINFIYNGFRESGLFMDYFKCYM